MSIRSRLMLTYGAALGATVVLMGVLVWWQMSDALVSALQTSLATRSYAVLNAIENQGQSGLQESDQPGSGVWVVLMNAQGQVVDASTDAPGNVKASAGVLVSGNRRYLTRVDSASDGTLVVTGGDLAPIEAAQNALARTLLGVASSVGLASALIGWLLAGRAFKPIKALILDAEALGPDDLDRRLSTPRTTDEVGRLAATLNGMLDRISDSVARQRLFVALASHELRTPLAALRAELEVADDEDASLDEYRVAVREAKVDAVRLGTLATGLLELATVGDEGRELVRSNVQIRALISSALRTVDPLKARSGARISVVGDDVSVRVDRVRMEQALVNLLSNAIVHSASTPDVEVRTRVVPRDHETVLIVSVLDRGPGFGLDDPTELLAPFRRGRRSLGGGAGLGLAMVANVARAHGGFVRADNRPGGGAAVTIVVPAGVREDSAARALEPAG